MLVVGIISLGCFNWFQVTLLIYCMAKDILGAPLLVGRHLTCDQSHHYHYHNHHHHHFSSTFLASRLCEKFRPIGKC